jgi:hypothetical protein
MLTGSINELGVEKSTIEARKSQKKREGKYMAAAINKWKRRNEG